MKGGTVRCAAIGSYGPSIGVSSIVAGAGFDGLTISRKASHAIMTRVNQSASPCR